MFQRETPCNSLHDFLSGEVSVSRARVQGHFFKQIVFDRARVQKDGATQTFAVVSFALSGMNNLDHHHNAGCCGQVLNI